MQLTITRTCSDNGLAPNRRQTFILTNADLIHWRIFVALGVDEVMLRFEQNDRHFADYIFKCAFFCTIKILLRFVPICLVDNKSALVKVMVWRRTWDKPLIESTVAKISYAT